MVRRSRGVDDSRLSPFLNSVAEVIAPVAIGVTNWMGGSSIDTVMCIIRVRMALCVVVLSLKASPFLPSSTTNKKHSRQKHKNFKICVGQNYD